MTPKLGERVAVNLSHLGGPLRMTVGILTEVPDDAGEGTKYTATLLGPGGVRGDVPLIIEQLRSAGEPLQPGQWCSLEILHRSGMGIFGL